MMLYHNIINSDDERVAKQLVKEQEKYGYGESWYSEVKKESMEIGIVIRECSEREDEVNMEERS